MSMEDSFMSIVREKMKRAGFYESVKRPGLFYRKEQLQGKTYYIDMSKQPTRMYGYEKTMADKDKAIPDEDVQKELKEIKRELISIGCDLSRFGIEKRSEEPKAKMKCPKCGWQWKPMEETE